MLNTSAVAADLSSALGTVFSGLAGYPRVAVAVSGGSDSMALVHALATWNGTQLVVLTVDHGLRAESAGEARYVAQWCAARGIDHQTLHWNGPKPVSGLQAAARQARYDAMTDWCSAHGVSVLLTAHTLDDQAETVAMRQSRTTSAKSLAGIWPETLWRGVRVIRPLLNTRREDLRNMLRAQGQGWIDDPSNFDERFERVRVRNSLPPGDHAKLAGVAEAAQRTHIATSKDVTEFYAVHASIDEYGVVSLPRAGLVELPSDVAHDVLARALYIAGSGVSPERTRVAALLHRIISGGTGRRTLAGAVVAARQSQVLVAREAGRIAMVWQPIHDAVLWDERFVLSAPSGSTVAPVALAKGLLRPESVPNYVWNSLPAVKLPDGRMISAVEATKFGISSIFRERIWF